MFTYCMNIIIHYIVKKFTISTILFFIFLPLYSQQSLLKRGDYCPGYITNNKQLLEWFSKFNMVEMGGIGDEANREIVNFLKENGVKIILAYDWMPAIYYYIDGQENNSLANYIYNNREETTLNPFGPFPHTEEMGYNFMRDYYLDFANSDVINKRINFELKFLNQHNYNGVFWDWGSGTFIFDSSFESMRARFNEMHHGKSYQESVKEFYKQLKTKLKPYGYVIFSNQGYRAESYVLPYINYDMAESYITGYDYFGKIIDVEGYGKMEIPETQYFPVSEPGKENFEDTLFYIDMINQLINKYGSKDFKKFIFMDYASPDFVLNSQTNKYEPRQPKDAIFLSFAGAKLINQTSYLEVTFDRKLDFHPMYFINLGNVYEDYYRKNKKQKYVVRFYQNGLVLIYYGNKKKIDIKIQSRFIPQNIGFYDMYEETSGTTNRNSMIIHIETKKDSLTSLRIPAARVIIYFTPQNMSPFYFKIPF